MYLHASDRDYNISMQCLYAREDDALRQPLLREGQALRELFRCPVFHGALLHSNAPKKMSGRSGAQLRCF
jgi:hypothetical protein